MSVLPQADHLVMSFEEANRIFRPNENRNIGLATTSAVAPNAGGTVRFKPDHPQTSSLRHAHFLGHKNERYENSKPSSPQEPPDVAVIPPFVPNKEQISKQPREMIEVTYPSPGAQLHSELPRECFFNPWFKFRTFMHIYFAEFLGTMVLVLWGEATQVQVVVLRDSPNDFLSISWGWAVGFMLGIYISSGISGGHINPAVTIALAVFRKFPCRRVPGYIASQMLGGFVGAAIAYIIYYTPLHAFPAGYSSVLTTSPNGITNVAAIFFSIFIGAALLMGAIAAFTDTNNNPTTPGMTPLLLGLIMLGLATSFGFQTGFILNPARDLAPRLFVWATGAPAHSLWLANAGYGIWQPTIGTITGALFGQAVYDLFLCQGRESPFNCDHSGTAWKTRCAWMRRHHSTASPQSSSNGSNHVDRRSLEQTMSGSTLRSDQWNHINNGIA